MATKLHKNANWRASDFGRYVYSGDVNVEHGGVWIDLSTWSDGYVDAVRVSDIDGGCGFTGAVLIEHITINGTDDPKRLREALHSCGYDGYLQGCHNKTIARHMLAEALMQYGYYDPNDCERRFVFGGVPSSEVVQCEDDGPMEFDGWKADKRLRGGDLAGYIRNVHLSE